MKCKFCRCKLSFQKVYNFKKNNISKIYHCKICKIFYSNHIIDKNFYKNKSKENLNYWYKINIFYFLKCFFLFFFAKKILNKIQTVKKNLKILDYGSGSGELANLLAIFSNKQIYASDLNINKKFYLKNIHVISNFKFDKCNFKFDVIILRHVLEHVKKIKYLFGKLKRISNKSSIFFIEVPNYNSFWRKKMGYKWPGFFYPYHYFVFSEKFLFLQLKKMGFQVIKKDKVEPPIFGAFFVSLGFNRNISRILSIFIYPVQLLISKIFRTSEGLLLTVRSKK